MKSVRDAYREMAEDNFPQEAYENLFRNGLDVNIAKKLLAKGFFPFTVERTIRSESPAIHSMPPKDARRYVQNLIPSNLKVSLPDDVMEGNNPECVEAYRQVKEEHSDSFARSFLPVDLKIVCKLLDDGYSMKESVDALNRYSIFAGEVGSSDLRKSYADSVMDRVNEVRSTQFEGMRDLAEKFYLSRAPEGKKLTTAQEGGIMLSMLAEGFRPDVIEDVFSEHSKSEAERNGYVRDLTDRCLKIWRMYLSIKTPFDANYMRTAADVYRYFAGDYMRKHKISLLNSKCDQAIVRRMFAEGLKEDFIRQALHFSPVASEPWREKDKYVAAVMDETQNTYKSRKDYAEKHYRLTASMYDEKIDRLSQLLAKKRPFGLEKNRSYYDGIVARELLEEHQLRSNIERVIADKSPQAKKENPLNPEKTPMGYAKWLVAAALKVLWAENTLLESVGKNIPESGRYEDLKKQGITAADLYRDAIRQRVKNYPSTAGMLTASFVDRDAIENIRTRFPDIDRIELENALHYESPRAFMPGIPEDYPVRVVDDVINRQIQLEEQQRKQEAFRKEMEAKARRDKEAITAGSPTWNLFLCSGLVAVRMLQEGYSAMDILHALQPDLSEKDAGWVVQKSETVVNRIENIKSYVPIEPEPVPDFKTVPSESDLKIAELAADEYKRRFQKVQEDKDKLLSDIDVEIVRGMTLKGFEPPVIQNVINANSPVAAEPGRSSDYSEYIQQQANIAIEKEKERLKVYRSMPRNQHEESPEKEYDFHFQNIRNSFFLPYEPLMDRFIAEAMLLQGFSAAAIGAIIQARSPIAGKEGYGAGIVREADRSILEQGREISAPVRVLARDS